VRKAVCAELGLFDDEILLEYSLVDDYGADGAEIANILLAVERSTGLPLDPAGLHRRSLALLTIGDLVEFVTAVATACWTSAGAWAHEGPARARARH
jgi:acyl carrier protein